jgi:hypothetical protein
MEALMTRLQNPVLSSNLLPNIRISPWLDRIFSFLGRAWVVCLECSIGLHLGAALGWIAGWCTALIYRDLCEPIHSVSLAASSIWHYLPYQYGRYGIITGAVLGTLIILLITLCKNSEQEDPELATQSC